MKVEDKKTLLLVEDEVLIALSKQKELEKYGYNVLTINTGEKAVVLVKENHEIDLILMDINLGSGIDGTEAAEIILKDQGIPVVFLSSHTDKETVEKTEKITSYGYVVKSSNITVLDASIKMAFKLFEAKKREKAKEVELRESEFFFRESQRAAYIGSYKTDFIKGFWKSSEVLDLIFGIDVNYNRSVQGWLDIVHPDDKEMMSSYLNEEVISKHIPFNKEYRIIRKSDNETRWVHGLGELVFNDEGNIISLIGTIYDITERKLAEKAMRESEEKYRTLFENESDAIFIYDPNTTNILDANEATCKTYGYNKNELIGMSCLEFSAEVEESASSIDKIRQDDEVNVPLRFHRRKDGTVFPVDISGYAITLSGENVMFAVSKDITERINAREEIIAISKFPNENPNPVLRISKDGSILFSNQASVSLRETWGCREEQCIPDNWRHIVKNALDKRITQEIEVESNERILSLFFTPVVEANYVNVYGRDITESVNAREELKLINNRLNISIENMPNAYIQLDCNSHVSEWNKEAEKIFGYSKEEMLGNNPINYIVCEQNRPIIEEVLKKLQSGETANYSAKNNNINKEGNLISCQWFNTPLLDNEGNVSGLITLAQDVTERLKAEEILQVSEKKFRELFEQAGDYILILELTEDKSLIIADANQAAYEIHGYDNKELIGKSIEELDRGLNEEQFEVQLNRVMSGKSTLFETVHVKKDGSIFPIEVSAKLLDIDKERQLIITIERDITERKHAEKLLEESEKRYHELYDNSPLGYQSLDAEGRFVEANPSLCNMLGYERKEIIGKWFGDFLSPKSLETFKSNFPKFKEKGEVHRVPFDLFSKDGRIVSIEIDGLIGFDELGHFKQTHCVMQNITKQKQTEANLLKSEYYLTKAQEIGKMGTWEMDIQKNTLKWTKENYKIFGVPIGAEINDDLFLDCVHPDDREYVHEKWSAGLKKEPYDIEHRIIMNGKVKWVREKADIEFDKTDNPIMAIGFTQDITNRKFIEEASDLSLFSMHNSRDAMYIMGSDARFIQVSESACKALGYTKEELLNMSVHDMGPDFPVEAWPAHWADLKKRGSFLIETIHRRKDKTTFPVEISVNYIKFGNKEYNCAFARDITERKQMEDSLQESERKYRLFLNNINMMAAIHEIVTDDNNKPIDFIYIDVNTKFEEVTHLKRADIIGKRALEVIPNLEQRWIDAYGKVAQTGEPITLIDHTEFLDKHWEVKVYSPEKNQFAIAATDITERIHAEQEVKHQLLEKEIILKEVHHRIKNNFASIGSILSLQTKSLTNPEVISALQDVIGRVNSMEVLYEKLLLTDDYSASSIKGYLEDLIEKIINLFSEDINITVEKQIDDFQLDPKRLVPIGIIVNELLTNIMKYGFRDRASGSLEIVVKENQGKVSLTIQDNGRGLPEGFDISESKGFGLMLVQILSQQLDGSFTFESSNGTKSTLEFYI